jgi:homoserine O-acetyltransferase
MNQEPDERGSEQNRTGYPTPVEGDFFIHDFPFKSGEHLPELKLHYTTLGNSVRDEAGVVRNAVLILHGTGGSGKGFLRDEFGGVLFGRRQPLSAAQYFVILPDGIGHGESSKPSDGLRARFPCYGYQDMVRAQHQLLVEELGVNHLRLVMGTSMGGMHTWLWGEMYPEFMDALMPLACLPVEIAGRNRMMRRMVIDAIRNSPGWRGGDYETQPRGLVSAVYTLLFMVSSPLQWQKQAPTREQADKLFDELAGKYLTDLDANDMLYQFSASWDYNPKPALGSIKVPLLAVNSADDQVNPPELGIMEEEIRRVKHGRYVLLGVDDRTRGHGTHSLAEVWQQHLADLLAESAPVQKAPPVKD